MNGSIPSVIVEDHCPWKEDVGRQAWDAGLRPDINVYKAFWSHHERIGEGRKSRPGTWQAKLEGGGNN
jgi:hypothetical protein